MKNTNIITWGKDHKRYIKSDEKAKLEAEIKSFYFDNVRLNGEKITKKL